MNAIRDAVYDGDLEALRTALETFPPGLNRSIELGGLLFVAMENYSLPCFELLLQHGAALGLFHEKDEETLLHAVGNQHDVLLPYLEALIVHGCEDYLEIRMVNGLTPFNFACSRRNFPVAQRLQQIGANVRTPSNEMDTPLHNSSGSPDLLELILNNGGEADLEAENTDGETPLYYACSQDSLECVQLLVNRGAQIGPTTLLYAVDINGNVDIVDFLLERGADPNGQADRDGSTPLHLACKILYGSTPFVHVLIEGGALVNARDNMNCTPLHLACKYGLISTIGTLLAAGADVTLADDSGNTPLHIAVASTLTSAERQLFIVKQLLEDGADPRIRNASYDRPAAVAVYPEISQYLLSRN